MRTTLFKRLTQNFPLLITFLRHSLWSPFPVSLKRTAVPTFAHATKLFKQHSLGQSVQLSVCFCECIFLFYNVYLVLGLPSSSVCLWLSFWCVWNMRVRSTEPCSVGFVFVLQDCGETSADGWFAERALWFLYRSG